MMKSLKAIPILSCLVALGACASTVRETRPTGKFVSHRGLDPTASCMVKELNEVSKTLTNDLAKSLNTAQTITNQIRIIDPGKSYEIGPLQAPMTDIYVVKLTAHANSETAVEVYSDQSNMGYSVLTPRLEAAVSKCL